MSREWQYKYGFSRLQVKLLGMVVPLFLIIATIFGTIFEITLYQEDKIKLQEKVEQVTQTFGVVVAEPLWNVDVERITSILEAITIDKDFVSAVVYDDEGNVFAAIGQAIDEAPSSFSSQQPVAFQSEMEPEPRVIGVLVISFTDKNLLTATYYRVAIEVTLAVVLIMVLVATNIFIHRKFVGTPLRRMLALIHAPFGKTQGQRVDWVSDDEIGVVVTAFNQMLEINEKDHDELEARVEDRTQALSEKSGVLLATLTNMRDGLVVFDAQGRMLTWNERYFEMFELPDRFQRVGQEYEEIIKFDAEHGFFERTLDLDSLIEKRLISFAEGRRETEEMFLSDGRIIEALRNPMSGGGQVCTYKDITKRKRGEKKMAETEGQLRAVLDNIAGGIRYVDRDRNYVFFNSQYLELYDFPDDLLKIGDSARIENLYQAKRGDYGSGDADSLADTLLEKFPVFVEPQSWECTTVHGKTLLVNTTPTPSGGIINIVTDITERKQAEEELRKAKVIAELANQSKSDFLSNMSHELRTPLNAILGFSVMIRDQMLGPKKSAVYAEYGADIFNSGRHLLRLINDLLDLSKIEAGKLELEFESLEVRTAILENVRTIEPIAARSGVELRTELDDTFPSLIVDHRAFDQIVLNLLSNAIKFTPRGGLVTIRGSSTGKNAEIVIVDTGIGIEPENIDKVMKPWGQITDPLRIVPKGSGLGLPIVKSLVELHGGELRLKSEVDKGTTVTVTLPNAGP